ncbi:hypothetical protein [Lyngbya sp. CCY1209]|uniref:hypothetical protein n=1 Tax=Lyngbya sp. CCY1209 TaxID=2886103 RepID=UPI002D214C78|nr:hypothetical protein [Lyngbya sp. CCY1209]MEB3884269.1 hypothetical protein [Lyngbya sp. CCY1209]
MKLQNRDFCFCTFAAGKVYRNLVKNLIQDCQKYAPGTPFILLTDRPGDFSDIKNNDVLIFGHKRQGVLCYHERRFAIANALSKFNSCMYLDADIRICALIPDNLSWFPGITARSCTSMMKHIRGRLDKTNPPRLTLVKEFNFYKDMAKKIGLDLEKDPITFVNEFLFVVTRDGGKEIEFLEQWQKLALYAELHQHHKHPAYAIGLAAAKVGFPIRHDTMEGIDFFDDRIEKVRIAKGQSDPEAKKMYFEVQKKIENSNSSIFDKIVRKITKNIEYIYHSVRLRSYF